MDFCLPSCPGLQAPDQCYRADGIMAGALLWPLCLSLSFSAVVSFTPSLSKSPACNSQRSGAGMGGKGLQQIPLGQGGRRPQVISRHVLSEEAKAGKGGPKISAEIQRPGMRRLRRVVGGKQQERGWARASFQTAATSVSKHPAGSLTGTWPHGPPHEASTEKTGKPWPFPQIPKHPFTSGEYFHAMTVRNFHGEAKALAEGFTCLKIRDISDTPVIWGRSAEGKAAKDPRPRRGRSRRGGQGDREGGVWEQVMETNAGAGQSFLNSCQCS